MRNMQIECYSCECRSNSYLIIGGADSYEQYFHSTDILECSHLRLLLLIYGCYCDSESGIGDSITRCTRLRYNQWCSYNRRVIVIQRMMNSCVIQRRTSFWQSLADDVRITSYNIRNYRSFFAGWALVPITRILGEPHNDPLKMNGEICEQFLIRLLTELN